jgi:hypothetical protein
MYLNLTLRGSRGHGMPEISSQAGMNVTGARYYILFQAGDEMTVLEYDFYRP